MLERSEKIARLRRVAGGEVRLDGAVDWIEVRDWPLRDHWFSGEQRYGDERFDRPAIRAALEGIAEAVADAHQGLKPSEEPRDKPQTAHEWGWRPPDEKDD